MIAERSSQNGVVVKRSSVRLDAQVARDWCLGLRLGERLGAHSCLAVAGRQVGLVYTEAALELIGLQVAQGYRQGIGGIGGFGDFLEAELCADHELHLAFIGMAVAGDAGFDFAGRVAADLQGMLLGGEQDDAADFGETQGGAHVQCGEDGFHCHDVGLELLDQLAEASVNVAESRAGRKPLAFWMNFPGAVVENVARAAGAFDDGVASGAGGGGVDAQNAKSGESFGHGK